MSNQYTVACRMTPEDVAIINGTKNVDSLVSMLIDTCSDDVLMSDLTWNSFWVREQQYALDYIY